MMKIMKFMFGKMNSKRKGITPVIAIVLLLMMTVAAAGVAYLWIMDLQAGMAKTADEGVDRHRRDVSSAITIESVWKDGGTGNLNFVIRNSGTDAYSAVEISQFAYYLDGVPQAAAAITQSCATAATLGAAGSICEVHLGTAFPTTIGDHTVIMVKTPIGKSATYTCRVRTSGDTTC